MEELWKSATEVSWKTGNQGHFTVNDIKHDVGYLIAVLPSPTPSRYALVELVTNNTWVTVINVTPTGITIVASFKVAVGTRTSDPQVVAYSGKHVYAYHRARLYVLNSTTGQIVSSTSYSLGDACVAWCATSNDHLVSIHHTGTRSVLRVKTSSATTVLASVAFDDACALRAYDTAFTVKIGSWVDAYTISPTGYACSKPPKDVQLVSMLDGHTTAFWDYRDDINTVTFYERSLDNGEPLKISVANIHGSSVVFSFAGLLNVLQMHVYKDNCSVTMTDGQYEYGGLLTAIWQLDRRAAFRTAILAAHRTRRLPAELWVHILKFLMCK